MSERRTFRGQTQNVKRRETRNQRKQKRETIENKNKNQRKSRLQHVIFGRNVRDTVSLIGIEREFRNLFGIIINSGGHIPKGRTSFYGFSWMELAIKERPEITVSN